MSKKTLDEAERYIRDSVSIEPLALESEYVRISSDQAYWNAKLADAFKAYERAKLNRKRLEALLQLQYREELSQSGKVTEKVIESHVSCDPRMHTAEDEELNAEVELVQMKGVCEAVRAKREMLVSFGAHVRAEMQGDPVVRNNQRIAREQREAYG